MPTRVQLGALPLVLLLSTCARSAAPEIKGGISVTDDLGRVIRLTRPARRIASLSPSNTEILFDLGCGDQVVLRDRLSSYPAQARRLPATSPFSLSAEHVAGFSPDLVLLSHLDPGRLRALEIVGLTVATFDPRTLDQLYSNFSAIGTLCGRPAAAAGHVEALRARVNRITERVRDCPRPLVYVETDGSDPLKPWTAGAGSLVDQLLQLAGGRNLAGGLRRPFAQISVEEIFTRRPEVILMMNVEESRGSGLTRLRARPGWSTLEAVRRQRVVDGIHADLLSRPGPRLVDGLEALARALHPGACRR